MVDRMCWMLHAWDAWMDILFVLRWAYTGCVLEPYHFSSSCKTRSIGVMGLFSFSCFSASCWLVYSAARMAVHFV